MEDHGKRHTPWCDRYAAAAATIRELESQNERLIYKLGVERKHGEQQSAKLKIATEALEEIAKGNRGKFESGDHMAFDKLMRAAEALARIKEIDK